MEATRESVIHELMVSEETNDEGEVIDTINLMTRAEAEALVDKHKAILDQGMRMGSYTYYVVAEILKAEQKV